MERSSRSLLSLAGWLLTIGLVLRLALSNLTLNAFTSYTQDGGNVIEKIHPGTYFIVIAYVITLHGRKNPPLGRMLRVSAYTLGAIITLIMMVNILRFGISSTAYFIDTFLSAVAACLTLEKIPLRFARGIYGLCVFICGLNMAVAVLEFALKAHFLPESGVDFIPFRSNAILGHPLTNSLITGFIILHVLFNRSLGIMSYAYFAFGIVAMFAFGGRASLLLTLIFTAFGIILRQVTDLFRNRIRPMAAFLTPIGFGLATAAVLFLFTSTDFGTRFREKADLSDKSANSRIELFSVYSHMNDRDVLYGVSPEKKEDILERMPDVQTIENFWVDMSVTMGLLLFLLFFPAMVLFCFSSSITKNASSWALLGYMLIGPSSNVSLSTKSPGLLVLVVVAVAFRLATQFRQPISGSLAIRRQFVPPATPAKR